MFIGREAGLFVKNGALTCKMWWLTCINKICKSGFSKVKMSTSITISHYFTVVCEASQMAQWKRICLPMQEKRAQSLGWDDPLEKEMATQSSILASKIPRTEEPGELQSMGSQRVGHNWAHTRSLNISELTGQVWRRAKTETQNKEGIAVRT